MADGNIKIKIDGAAAAAEADRVKKSLIGVDEGAKKAASSTEDLNKSLRQMKSSGADKIVQSLNKGFKDLTSSAASSSKSLSEINRNVKLLQESNSKLLAVTRQMAKELSLLGNTTGTTGAKVVSATGATARFGTQLSATATVANNFNRIMLAFGQGFSLAYAVRTLTEFDHSMATVQAITKATGQDIINLRDKAKELGAQTIYTSGEAAQAMKFLAQSGFSTNEIISASSGVLALAQAANMGLAETSEIAAKALRGFRLDATQMSEVADILSAAITQSTMNLRELGDSFKYVAPIASALGINMREAAGFVGVLSDAGIDASMAGTSMRRIFSELTNPTIKATKLINVLGLEMTDLDVKTQGLVVVIRKLIAAGIDVDTAFSLFGDRGAVAFLTLANNIDTVEQKIANLNNVSGRAAEMQRVMASSLFAVWKEFTSALEFFIIESSEISGLLNVVKDTLQSMAKAIRETVKDFESFVPVVSLLSGLIGTRLVLGVVSLTRSFAAMGAMGTVSFAKLQPMLSATNAQLISMGVNATVAAGATRVLGVALSLVGGLPGLAITGLVYALTSYAMETSRAEQVTYKYATALEHLKKGTKSLAEITKEAADSLKGLTIEELKKRLTSDQKDMDRIWKEVLVEIPRKYFQEQVSVVEKGLRAYKGIASVSDLDFANLQRSVAELVKSFENTGDIEAFNRGMDKLAVGVNKANTPVLNFIAEMRNAVQLLSLNKGTVVSTAEAIKALEESTGGAAIKTKQLTESLRSLFATAAGYDKFIQYATDLDQQITLMERVPKNMRATYTSFFNAIGEGARGIVIDWKTMNLTFKEGFDVSEKQIELIQEAWGKAKKLAGLEALESGMKATAKATNEVERELNRLLMTDLEFRNAEARRELEKLQATLGKSNPVLKEYAKNLEIAQAAGFADPKEASKARTEIEKMMKIATMGETEYKISEINRTYDALVQVDAARGREFVDLEKGRQYEINKVIREGKDKDLQVQIQFWQQYIQVATQRGADYNAVIERMLEQQKDIWLAAGIGIADVDAMINAMRLENSRRFEDGITRGIQKRIADYSNEAKSMEQLFNTTINSMEDVWANWLIDGELDFKNFVNVVGKEIAKLALQMMILKPLFEGISNSSWFSSLFGTAVKSAKGNVFNGGRTVKPFASGGIVSSPTLFPMRRGAGLMGEAGPEAIMPLTRLPSGRLGVESASASGGGFVLNNVNYIDIQGGGGGGGERTGGTELAEEISEKITIGLEEFVVNTMLKQSKPGGVLYGR